MVQSWAIRVSMLVSLCDACDVTRLLLTPFDECELGRSSSLTVSISKPTFNKKRSIARPLNSD